MYPSTLTARVTAVADLIIKSKLAVIFLGVVNETVEGALAPNNAVKNTVPAPSCKSTLLAALAERVILVT